MRKQGNKSAITRWTVWAILAAGLAVTLYATQAYGLAARASQKMFVFDADWIADRIFQIGGFADLLARFCTQFFGCLLVGPAVTALIVTRCAALIFNTLKEDSAELPELVLFCVGVLFAVLPVVDLQFRYSGLIAFLLTCEAISIHIRIRTGRCFAGIFTAILLYLLAGPVAAVFAICTVILEIAEGKRPWSLAAVAAVVLTALVCVRAGEFGSIQRALTPSFYYEMSAGQMPAVHWAPWIALPATYILALLMVRLNSPARAFAANTLMSLGLIVFSTLYRDQCDVMVSRTARLEYSAARGKWDDIIAMLDRDTRSFEEANYLNLAYSEKGQLLDKLFARRQNGPYSLIANVGSHAKHDMVRLSHIFFSIGNMAAAQSLAFNADQDLEGSIPMLKIVTDVDIMRGSSAVARKNLSLLRKTVARRWAKERLAYLDGTLSPEEDSFRLLERGKRSFPEEEAFVLENVVKDMYRTVDADPSNEAAVNYALAYLLLAKDYYRTVDFVKTYSQSPALEELPRCVKECLAFFADYYGPMDPAFAEANGMPAETLMLYKSYDYDFCRRHGVTDDIFADYRDFMASFQEVRSGRANLSEMNKYSRTFWYYMFFIELNQEKK